jgi:LysR family transcriptional regulator, pca operon transcriptional activator
MQAGDSEPYHPEQLSIRCTSNTQEVCWSGSQLAALEGTMVRHLSRRLKLHHLRVVDALASYKSLLQASHALGISQPALSKSIRELEETMGVTLFERHAKGMRSNHFGALVEESARRIIAELAHLDAQLDSQLEPNSGSITLGTLPVTAVGFLPGLLVALRVAMPDLCINVVQSDTEQMLSSLLAGDVDLVIGRLYEPAHSELFAREQLYDEPISLLAREGHPLFATNQIRQRDLCEYGLVLPGMTHRVGKEIEEALAGMKLEPPGSALRSNSLGLIRELLLTTEMLAAMPRLMMAGDLIRGTVRSLPLPAPTPSRPAGIFYAEGRPLTPLLEAFVAFTRNYVERLRGSVLPL